MINDKCLGVLLSLIVLDAIKGVLVLINELDYSHKPSFYLNAIVGLDGSILNSGTPNVIELLCLLLSLISLFYSYSPKDTLETVHL